MVAPTSLHYMSEIERELPALAAVEHRLAIATAGSPIAETLDLPPTGDGSRLAIAVPELLRIINCTPGNDSDKTLIVYLSGEGSGKPKQIVEQPPVTFADSRVEIDFNGHRARADGQLLDLTLREFRLLGYLGINAGSIISRGKIASTVWGPECNNTSDYISPYVFRLRAKLGKELGGPKGAIRTIRAKGYKAVKSLAEI